MNKPRAPLGLASKVWALVEEPKTITLIQVVWVYFGAVVFGTLATFYPPRTTSVVLGDWSVTAITLAMVFAGLVGIITATFGVWWVERLLAIGVLMIAGALYMYSVGEAQFMGDGHRWLQMGWVWTALGGLVIRYVRIRKSNYDPVT